MLRFGIFTLTSFKPTDIPRELVTVGDHLKKRRLELDLLQKDVALKLSVNPWTVCNWENNKTSPFVSYLPRIIEFLGYYPFPEPQNLGEEIAYRRRMLGLSRKLLAKKLGVDEATVAMWENGMTSPKGKHLQQVRILQSLKK